MNRDSGASSAGGLAVVPVAGLCLRETWQWGVDGDRSAALLSLGLAGGLTLVLAWAATDWLFRREAHRLLETLRARTSKAPSGHARRRPIAPR